MSKVNLYNLYWPDVNIKTGDYFVRHKHQQKMEMNLNVAETGTLA